MYKRRSLYDKTQLDYAVDLIINNKLSLRAASLIYKIPFSTLRTRKILLTQDIDLNSSINSTQNSLQITDDNEDENDSLKFETRSACKLKKNLFGLKSNRLKLGKKLGKKFNTINNRPKRLYIRRDKLEKLIKANDFKTISTMIDNQDVDKNEIIKETTNNKNVIKPNKIIKITSSCSINSIDELKPHQTIEPKLSASLSITNRNKTELFNRTNSFDSIASSKTETTETTNGLDNVKNYLIEIKTDPGNLVETSRKNTLFECFNCENSFVNLQKLHEHQNYACCKSTKSLLEKASGSTNRLETRSGYKCYFCKQTHRNQLSFMTHTLLCSAVNCF